MKPFLDNNFLLQTKSAEELYYNYAAAMPIIDYHNHLPPQQIANNHQFQNITQAWLYGDHYKWRAMRTNGVNERFCTGNASDEEKFTAWAATVPYTMRNPLYHWTHLELQRYFNINTILNAQSATDIYTQASALLQQPNMAVQGLLKKMNVEVVCTTDDPIDNLEFHQQMQQQQGLQMLPAFRPDKAMFIEDVAFFNNYLQQLSTVTNIQINTVEAYLEAIKNRHNYFAANGCTVSDHGLEQLYTEPYTATEIETIFQKVLQGVQPNTKEVCQFKNFALTQIAILNHSKNWVQQFHLGALRNNNSRMLQQLGADTGWDSIGDFSQAKYLSAFLNNLDKNNQLAKTIIYNLNPADNELMATMIGNFNDGSVAGKVQWGSAWWFLDQKDGMEKQLNALSNMGLVSKFVGMLTDSRSFLSFPRHEYFRRILCNLFGNEIENGELPNDTKWIGKLVQDICYNNAKQYFGF